MALATEQLAVHIPAGPVELEADLTVPESARGIVAFAHGSGSSRHSRRNRYVAAELHRAGLATLLLDLLTLQEERVDHVSGEFRFDLELLAERLVHAADFLAAEPHTKDLRLGLFGASTGGGAALIAAARKPDSIRAVVSRGGRPDLAADALAEVKCPVLLIVGGYDYPVIEMNEQAMTKMRCPKEMLIIPRATHLFEEPGALEQVAALASHWFQQYLAPKPE